MPDSTTEPMRNSDAATTAKKRTKRLTPTAQPPWPTTDEPPEEVVNLVRRGKLPLAIRRANSGDLSSVLELIDEAKLWLPSKGTRQWSTDWADQEGRKRSDRAQDSLLQGTTRIVTAAHRGQSFAVATMTIEPGANPMVWDRPGDLDDSAVYLSRLVVARKFAGLKIGTALLNWACDYARGRHQADMVRIDVWTRNFALHKYYRTQGFRWQGYCANTSYPSRARFQRSTSKKIRRAPPLSATFGTFL
jgi:ribosomal protein S18 acetylase RimI-like enzyme